MSQSDAPGPISRGEAFVAHSLTARAFDNPANVPHHEDGGRFNPSMLNADERQQFGYDRDHHEGGIDYIVYSYDTPIAWRRAGGTWHVVDQKFSVTTSVKHQSKLYLIPADKITTGRGARVGA